jgi:REP element-mobilizing transposase RayT
MARKRREDEAGSWHHVINRGQAHRPVFEGAADIRKFLAELARAVRRGEIEVHAWCVLTTHYHLLIYSPCGKLSKAMQRVLSAFVQRFNRTRERDGALFRGRFYSKRVKSESYRWQVVRYIDGNPVDAKLCDEPCAYPWGSARQYARPRGPRWLRREWVEGEVAARANRSRYDPADYPRAFDPELHALRQELVDSRWAHGSHDARDDLDSLLSMADEGTLAWLRANVELADGKLMPQPAAPASAIDAEIARLTASGAPFLIPTARRPAHGWRTLHAGLLRTLARESFESIAARLTTSSPQARRLARRHAKLMTTDDTYARVATRATRAIVVGWGSDPPSSEWSGREDLNLRPLRPERNALPS